MEFLKKKGWGILVCAVIAGVSTLLGGLRLGAVSLEIVGAPVFAIIIGMLITLAKKEFAPSAPMKEGIRFTSKKILQWAVIILGFSLNLGTVLMVGGRSLPIILSTIAASLIMAYLMMKILRLDATTSTLIGVGSSICGGSAIAATASIIDADDKQVAQAVSVIFLFNVAAALVFPTLGHALGLGSEGFAVFAGTAVNDTSSVTACAAAAEGIYGVDGILSAAVTVKLTRTLAIIPITLVLAFWQARKARRVGGEAAKGYSLKKIFPFFILYFLGAALLTTCVGLLPEGGVAAAYFGTFVPASKWLAKFFIAMAMAAIGLNTDVVELIRKGGKPIAMGFACWVAIILTSLGMQLLTGMYYTWL